MVMKLFIALLLGLVIWQVTNPDFRLSPKEVIVRKVPPMNVEYQTTEATTYLNTIRSNMGMQRLSDNDILTKAAMAHSEYMLLNNESTHIEIEGHRNFTGVKPVNRVFKAGYLSLQVSENISTAHHTAHESIDGLFSAIYHRFGFLSTTINEIGVGIVQDTLDSDKSAFTYLMGNSDLNVLCNGSSFTGNGRYMKGCEDQSQRIKVKDVLTALNYSKQSNPDIIVYPYDKQRNISPVFYGEDPDPLPNYDVSGFPISIEFNDYFYKDVTVLSFTLTDREGNSIKVQPMDSETDPNLRFTNKQFALFPLKRLDYNAQYFVEVTYKAKEKIKKKLWSFYTTRIQEEFYQVDKLYDELTIKLNHTYVIYFPPIDAHDLLEDLQFPSGVDIQFLDHNTIKMSLISEGMIKGIDAFTLDTGKKKLHIKIAH